MLSARSSPMVPASQTYEPLVKSALGRRFIRNILAFSAAFTIVVQVLFAGEGDTSAFARLLQLRTWVAACFKWSTGVLPVIALRKVCLTSAAAPAASPAKMLAHAIAKPSTRRSLAVYMSCAMMLTALNLGSLTSSERDDLRLNVFVKSRKHPYYLNGRFLFLISAQLWLAASFVLRNVMLDRFVFRWANLKSSNSSGLPFAPSNLMKLTLTMTIFTSCSMMVFSLAFGLSRILVLPLLLKLPVVNSLVRPFTAHLARGPWTPSLPILHWSLVVRSFTMGLMTVMNWEFAESLFDVYIPQPIRVGAINADPNVTIVSGILTQDTVFAHFAYWELVQLASDDSPAGSALRSALFSDQKYSPTLWNVLARQSLLRLGRDYQTFLRRGAPVTLPPVVAPAAPKPKDPPLTPLIRRAIFKSPRESPLGSMLNCVASDSDLSKAAEAVAGEMQEKASQMHIPDLFRSVAPPPVHAPTIIPIPGSPTTRMRWHEWFYRERLNKVVEACLPNRELDALIIEALSHFVSASLSEDRYGVVQRDIPRIIEALLSFLSAIEEYQVEVNAKYIPPTPDELSQGDTKILEDKETIRVEVARAGEALGVVSDALKTGVENISRTFGDKLVAFKFPPRTARKLQSFVDYI